MNVIHSSRGVGGKEFKDHLEEPSLMWLHDGQDALKPLYGLKLCLGQSIIENLKLF